MMSHRQDRPARKASPQAAPSASRAIPAPFTPPPMRGDRRVCPFPLKRQGHLGSRLINRPARHGFKIEPDDPAGIPRRRRRCVRLADDQHCACARTRSSEESCISKGVPQGARFSGPQVRAHISWRLSLARSALPGSPLRFVTPRVRIAGKRRTRGARNRIPARRPQRDFRAAKDDHVAKPSMDHRFSRPHRDPPKVQFHALLGERGLTRS